MGDFNLATRQFKQVLSPQSYVASGTSQQDLPQVGYLARIDCIVTGTVTASAAGATAATYVPPPFGLIKRIKLSTNEGADIWSTSAWGAYVYGRTLRTGYDVAVNHADFLGGFNDPYSAYFAAPGTLGASASASFVIPISLQLSWGEMLLSGLILLQNPGVRFTLSVDWGTGTDLYSANGATCTFSNVQLVPQLTLYHVPADPQDQPDLAFAKTVLEDIQTITAAGVQTYRPLMGNTYTRIIHELINGGTTPFTKTEVTDHNITFAQTQSVYTEKTAHKLMEQRRLYGGDLPAGVFVHEFSLGNGVPEFPNGRDNFDTSQITDMAVNTTIASGTTVNAGSYMRTIREQLVLVRG